MVLGLRGEGQYEGGRAFRAVSGHVFRGESLAGGATEELARASAGSDWFWLWLRPKRKNPFS